MSYLLLSRLFCRLLRFCLGLHNANVSRRLHRNGAENTHLFLLLLQLRARLPFRRDPVLHVFHAFAWAGLVLEEVTLQARNAEFVFRNCIAEALCEHRKLLLVEKRDRMSRRFAATRKIAQGRVNAGRLQRHRRVLHRRRWRRACHAPHARRDRDSTRRNRRRLLDRLDWEEALEDALGLPLGGVLEVDPDVHAARAAQRGIQPLDVVRRREQQAALGGRDAVERVEQARERERAPVIGRLRLGRRRTRRSGRRRARCPGIARDGARECGIEILEQEDAAGYGNEGPLYISGRLGRNEDGKSGAYREGTCPMSVESVLSLILCNKNESIVT